MESTRLLDGISILDLSQLIAGPSATSMLAEQGADVIKLESPSGDPSRKMGAARRYGFSSTFAAYNKGKRSISVNLQSAEGIQVCHRLIKNADVIIEAFRPGVMDRLGLGFEQIQAIKPDIVYVSFSGFGEDGPMAQRPGVDLLIQGESGIMSITGEENGSPLKIGFTAVDAAAGFALSGAILAGLLKKHRTGQGSRLNMSLMDVALYMQAGPITEYLMNGAVPPRTGNKAPLGSPAEVFKTKDGSLIVSAYFTHQWGDLCRLMELETLVDDPRFHDNEARIANRSELHELLQARFITKTSDAWKALLKPTRIIFGDVLDYPQVVASDQIKQSNTLINIETAEGTVPSVATPLKATGQQPPALALPLLGEHTQEILAEIGYAQQEITDLKEKGVVFY